MTADSRPWAVILTRGALPGEDTPEPDSLECTLAAGKAGITPETLIAPQVAVYAREMYRLGYERAAQAHRVAAVYLIGGSEERAAGFAAWVTREIDPAYVMHPRDPLAEMLGAAGPEDRSTRYPPGGPPAPGHRALRLILRDAIRARKDPAVLSGLRAEYDAAAAALFGMLAEKPENRHDG